ncbi:MAG: hypothetical protein ACRCZA_00130 [Shewanella sp.]|uniref:hypothetical protein n=1 Tax=Shewanella sp. TaxID=50422 RepID=UPI003F38BD23
MASMTNISALKSIAKQLARTTFVQNWQWRVAFSGAGVNPPSDFDIYCRSIEHGGLTIEYESKQVGAVTINSPTHKTAGTVTLTIRDHEDFRCEKFFRRMAAKVLNDDGTINLPSSYLFKMAIYIINQDGSETLYNQWDVSAGEFGGFTRGRDEIGAFVSYPMVFQKYKSI